MTARLANSKLAFLDSLWTPPFLGSPIVTGLITGPAVWFSILLTSHTYNLSTVWMANAVVFLWLLPLPPRRLPLHLLAAAVANASAGWYFHHPASMILITSSANAAEVALLLLFTHRYYDAPARRFRISALRFTLLTIAVAVIVCTSMAPFLYRYLQIEPVATMLNWIFGDVLGLLLVTALVGFWRRHAFVQPFQRRQLDGTLSCIAIVLAGTWLIFSQNSYPLMFVVVSILIYVLFRRGLALATLCLAVHAIGASFFTLHGSGPLGLLPDATLLTRIVGLQIYLFILLATIYPVGAALYAQQKLQALYAVLADNTGDVVVRADLNGFRQYCSPSVVRVLGWTPEEMVNIESADSYHPDDAARLKALFQKMRDGLTTSCVEPYRIRAKSGQYVWMEGHIHVLLDSVTGDPAGFIANFRDISERVAAEAKLKVAHHALQRLASTDPLTNLANRRTFDESLEREWRRAQRERTPLAVIMMDVDHFKKYNDSLGHPAGDECMRRIAMCLTQVVQRPSDMVARYGGEEFVALLPFTEATGAQQLGQRIIEALATLALPHPSSPTRATVTLSIGVASIFPSLGYSPTSVVAAADRALYLAKNNGRNRMEISQPERDPSPHRAGWEHLRIETNLETTLDIGDLPSAIVGLGITDINPLGDSRSADRERNEQTDPVPATAFPLL